MNKKHLAIFATAGLIWSVSPVFAMDGIGRLVATGSAKADTANDQALQSQAVPTDLSAARKKKGKGGPKGGEPYMTSELENAMITSFPSKQGGRPNRPPGGGLLRLHRRQLRSECSVSDRHAFGASGRPWCRPGDQVKHPASPGRPAPHRA